MPKYIQSSLNIVLECSWFKETNNKDKCTDKNTYGHIVDDLNSLMSFGKDNSLCDIFTLPSDDVKPWGHVDYVDLKWKGELSCCDVRQNATIKQ